jgi:hypothetical protein
MMRLWSVVHGESGSGGREGEGGLLRERKRLERDGSGLMSKPLEFERFNCGETALIRIGVSLLIRAES